MNTRAERCCCPQAALWTRLFKHHLDLGHNAEAYEALTQNPDSSMYVESLFRRWNLSPSDQVHLSGFPLGQVQKHERRGGWEALNCVCCGGWRVGVEPLGPC